MDVKIEIRLHVDDEDNKHFGEEWEELEDEIRDLILEKFGGWVQGEIENEATGNITAVCAPVCPHCGQPVLYLENEQDLLVRWNMYRNGEYSPVPDLENLEHIGDINHWLCPICHEEIAKTQEDAIKFLNCE